jgi:hypothetical protein
LYEEAHQRAAATTTGTRGTSNDEEFVLAGVEYGLGFAVP